jgi:hypothetical protein
MQFNGYTIIFKSKMPFFEKEQCGDKANTVRLMTDDEAKLVRSKWQRGEMSRISIVDATRNFKELHEFNRLLTDVSFTGEILGLYMVIFSWRHE